MLQSTFWLVTGRTGWGVGKEGNLRILPCHPLPPPAAIKTMSKERVLCQGDGGADRVRSLPLGETGFLTGGRQETAGADTVPAPGGEGSGLGAPGWH